MIVDMELRQPTTDAAFESEVSDFRKLAAQRGEEVRLSNEMGKSSRPENFPHDASLPPSSEVGRELNSTQSIGNQVPPNPFDEILAGCKLNPPALNAEAENKNQYKPTDSNGNVTRWEPKQLNSRHREMMRRILEGATYIEIAIDMGISVASVQLVCSSEIFKTELAILESKLEMNVIRRAEELSNEALDKLKRLMRSAKAESLQASCAEKVLGIAGYSKIEKKQISMISGEDVIRELNRRRRELVEAKEVAVN